MTDTLRSRIIAHTDQPDIYDPPAHTDMYARILRDAETIKAAEALAEKLRPFDACIFNDNGDVTISTGHLTRKDWIALRTLHTDASLAAIERIKREARNEVLNGVAKALSHAGNEGAASIVTALIEKDGV